MTALAVYRQGFTFSKWKGTEWWRALCGWALATCKLVQKFKGKSSDFIYSANMPSNSESSNQSPILPTVLSWLKRAQQHSAQNILPQNRRQVAAFCLAFPYLVTQFWGGMTLHTRNSELLLPSEHGAFMVSKQIWRRVLPHVWTGNWAEKELGESQTMPGSWKKKPTKNLESSLLWRHSILLKSIHRNKMFSCNTPLMASLSSFISHLPINLKIYNVARWTALNLETIPVPLGHWCMVIQ